MTGTSIDGLDAALVRIEGTGLAMRAEFVRGASRPLGELGPRLRRLADQEPVTAGEIARLSRDFALLHAETIAELLRVPAPALDPRINPDLIAVHGQTVFHAPPLSWQMFNPTVLAEATGTPVVCDLRAADLARGGQGAPITPIADWVMFSDEHQPTAVVNLGGFCNVTLLPAGVRDHASLAAVRGFDVCACNHLLNAVARLMLDAEYDAGGAAALRGGVVEDVLEGLLDVLAGQSRGGRSLGTGDEAGAWVARHRASASAEDLAATVCEAIGRNIAVRVRETGHVLLAGGGVHNAALVRSISVHCPAKVQTVDELGVPAPYREAAAMAVLGALCADRVPITLPGVTGVKAAPVAGIWACP